MIGLIICFPIQQIRGGKRHIGYSMYCSLMYYMYCMPACITSLKGAIIFLPSSFAHILLPMGGLFGADFAGATNFLDNGR